MSKKPLDRERVMRDYNRLQKELEKERRLENEQLKANSRLRLKAVEERKALLKTRIEQLGLGGFINLGVHCVHWDLDGDHPEVWFSISGSAGANSETVLEAFLDRLEELLKGVAK